MCYLEINGEFFLKSNMHDVELLISKLKYPHVGEVMVEDGGTVYNLPYIFDSDLLLTFLWSDITPIEMW